MAAPNDLEARARQILDNAYWLQDICCAGCTNVFSSHADIVDGYLVFSDPKCLKPDCPGHDPVTAYQKALQALVRHGVYQAKELLPYGLIPSKEATDASANRPEL